jgi:hypothetical protein
VAITEKLQILITADGRAAQQEFNKLGRNAEQSIGKTDDRLQQLSGQMVSFGAATVVAGGVAAAGLFKLASAAGDLSEAQNKANVVLGKDGAAALEEFADGAASAAGLTKTAATSAATTFAVFGKAAGLTGQGLADFSIELTKLSSDLASFNNTTTDEAITAIGAALRGESEPIRAYGVLLDDATLKAEAMSQGIYDGSGSLTQQQRVMAAYTQILKQTTDAQGDFGATSDGLANRQRILSAEFGNTQAAVGEALLPAFESLVGSAQNVFGAFNALPKSAQSAIGGFAGVATAGTIAAGGVTLAIGAGLRAATVYTDLTAKINNAGRAMQFAGKAGAGLAGAGLVIGAFVAVDQALISAVGAAGKLQDALGELKIATDELATTQAVDSAISASFEEQINLSNLLTANFSKSAAVNDAFNASLADSTATAQLFLDTLKDSGNYNIVEGVSLQDLKEGSDELTIFTSELEGWQKQIDEKLQLDIKGALAQKQYNQAVADGVAELEGGGKAAEDNADGVDAAKEATEGLKAALTKLSSVQKLANLQFDVGAKRAEAFGDAIERSTNADDLLSSAVGAGRALGDLRETLGLIPAEADAAEKSSDEASKTLERLSDAAKSADPALSDLAISMDGAAAGADAFNKSLASASGFGAQLDAAVDLGEAFDKLDRSARRLPKTIDLTAIALGELRPRQRDAINDLRDLGSATNDYLTALLKTGATSDEVRNQAAGFRVELEKQLRAAGLSEEAIRQYVEAASLAPEQIETAIKLSGIESARFKLNAYLGLLDGKIPPEVATTIIAAIERDDLNGAAGILRDFAKTNPVAIDFTPEGVDKIDEAKGKLTDLPRVYDPARIAAGEYTTANLNALDSVLGLGDAYKDYLSNLASTGQGDKAISEAGRLRESFAKTVAGLELTKTELESYYQLLGIAEPQVETAVKISIDDAELFALTTTIDLLTGMDELSPEVQLQLSDALLRGDYEEVRSLLESEVQVALGVDPIIGEETYRKITERWRSEQQNIPVGIDDTEARSDAAALFFDIGRLAPIIKVGIEYAFDAGAATGAAALSGAGRLAGAGVGFGGKLGGGQAPYPGGYDGNPATPYPRAKGGPVGPGRDYLVGEEGPELVTFGAAGTVIPAGPTAQLMQPTSSLGNDKGQAELLAALRDLAAAQAQASGDTVNVYESTSARQTAEEILRVKQANRFLAGRA